MPELPEVETVVRTLRPRLLGAVTVAVWTSGKGLRMARPVDRAALARLSTDAKITGVRRKGKYILIDLERGPAGILVHLGMSGRLRVQAASEPRAPHTHVVWSLAGGDELRFCRRPRLPTPPGAISVQPPDFVRLDRMGRSRSARSENRTSARSSPDTAGECADTCRVAVS